MDRIAYSLPEAARIAGVSRTRIFRIRRIAHVAVDPVLNEGQANALAG
jgi:hypothetical protein